jgi:hypothetical protein
VTVGGAIANDVHGKNHHVLGSFGDHIHSPTLVRTDGQAIQCGPAERSDWFAATVGGLGLTGVITQAEIQLRRVAGPWLDTETIPYANLDEFFVLADESEAEWEHTFSWIDCMSAKGERGLFMRGNPSNVADRPAPKSRKLTMPLVPPVSLVNRLTLRPFNMAYFNLKKWQAGRAISYYESFFARSTICLSGIGSTDPRVFISTRVSYLAQSAKMRFRQCSKKLHALKMVRFSLCLKLLVIANQLVC